jgi:hypothetical protein
MGDRLDPADVARSGIRQVIAKQLQTSPLLRVVADRATGGGA